MIDLSTLQLGTIGLLILTYSIALFGYLSDDDALFELGIYATFVAILVTAAVQVWQSRDDSTPGSHSG